ncbi:LysR family transcriptional regulator [Halomonas urumqiensis]|uniref:LysR family transcriptional regulator n=1 Tax=Halomonas urumqiensis TaxID=1684789 RepID=A0A2N7UQP8_9GAMM|nr:LysR family transcriptional regulator [Halomonas urumqiensis]PMR82742.1 LysR family transcriptional regulator [Halomonas urumqiensis]PTB01939.1 LysR family transcriptional regulator [Halomonas urumqiensis]GHE22048.1 LysR family transcriptional regulator [Halomonas urumqiensis]
MNIRHLTFRLLQVYAVVVHAGSVSEAARRLHLTQPTVSQQLKRLAETVGEPLLESRHGRLVPTEAGGELYRASREVLGRFDDFEDYLASLRGGARGRCSIALVNTAQYVLPRLLGPYSRAFPEVDVTLHIGNRRQVLTRFERQDDDLYVFSHPPSLAHARAGRFLRNPLVAVAPRGHPLAGRRQVAMSELLAERFLLREPGSATRMLFESWLQEQGLTLGPTLQMASNEAIRVGVASGLGLAVLSEHVLPPEHPDLVILPVAGLPIESHWQFIVRRDRRLSHASLGLLRFAEAHLHECVEPHFLCNELAGLLEGVGVAANS